MIVQKVESLPIQFSNDMPTAQFTIQASGAAFDILSSGLYQNKALAIVRELACNAYDSHVSAGKSTVPILVKVPTTLDPTFCVTDYGVGLSQAQVMGYHKESGEYVGGIYNTYFQSTKDTSNDFIGSFGLGSKSPYCYADNFTVISKFGGIEYIYSCYKNSFNLPTVSLVSSLPTTDGNGLSVSFLVKDGDVYKFQRAAQTALTFFDPRPTIVGLYSHITPNDYIYTVTGSNWKLRKDSPLSSVDSGAYIIQGFCFYPVDVSSLVGIEVSDIIKRLMRSDINVFVGIGEVDVTASRESLSYTPKTIASLVHIFTDIATETRYAIQEKFDNCRSPWEVAVLANELENRSPDHGFGGVYSTHHSHAPFTYCDKPVRKLVPIDSSDFDGISVTMIDITRYGKPSITKVLDGPGSSLEGRSDYIVLFDKHRRSRVAYMEFLKDHPKKVLIVIKPDNKKNNRDDQFNKFIGLMDNPEHFTLPNPAKQPQSARSIPAIVPFKWTGFGRKRDRYGVHAQIHRKFTPSCWEEAPTITEGVYVEISKWGVRVPGQSGPAYDFDDIIDSCKCCDILPSDVVVYGINSTTLKKSNISNNPNWINLFDLVVNKFKDKKWVASVANSRHVNQFGGTNHTFHGYLIEEWSSIEPLFCDGRYKQFLELLVDAENYKLTQQQIAGASMLDHKLRLHKISKMETNPGLLNELYSDLFERYPMIEFVRFPSYKSEVPNFLPAFLSYIRQVDEPDTIIQPQI